MATSKDLKQHGQWISQHSTKMVTILRQTCQKFVIAFFLFLVLLIWFLNRSSVTQLRKATDLLPPQRDLPQLQVEDEPRPRRDLKPWQAIALFEWDTSHPATNGIKCNKVLGVGNKKLCMDEPYKIEPPCLVYSFGIDYQWSFDDAMGKFGCEVHSFDPSMVKVTDHKRSEHVTFHRLGLAGKDIGFVNPPAIGGLVNKTYQTWELRKLNTIKKRLGHENRTIDVLKMDIESYEWDVLKNFYQEGVLDDVSQFIMEWHVFFKRPQKSELPETYRLYEHLEEIGFRSFYKAYDTVDNKPDLSAFHTQSDTCWVNTNKARKRTT